VRPDAPPIGASDYALLSAPKPHAHFNGTATSGGIVADERIKLLLYANPCYCHTVCSLRQIPTPRRFGDWVGFLAARVEFKQTLREKPIQVRFSRGPKVTRGRGRASTRFFIQQPLAAASDRVIELRPPPGPSAIASAVRLVRESLTLSLRDRDGSLLLMRRSRPRGNSPFAAARPDVVSSTLSHTKPAAIIPPAQGLMLRGETRCLRACRDR